MHHLFVERMRGEVSNAKDPPVRAILLPDFPFHPVPAFIFHLAYLLASKPLCRTIFNGWKVTLNQFILFSRGAK